MVQTPSTGSNVIGKGEISQNPRSGSSNSPIAEITSPTNNTHPEYETPPPVAQPFTALVNSTGVNVEQTTLTAYPSAVIVPSTVANSAPVVPFRPVARRAGEGSGYSSTVSRVINPSAYLSIPVLPSNVVRPVPEHERIYLSTGSFNNNMRPIMPTNAPPRTSGPMNTVARPVNRRQRNAGPTVEGSSPGGSSHGRKFRSMVDIMATALRAPTQMPLPTPSPTQVPQSEEMPHYCLVCMKQFRTVQGLRGHMRSHQHRGLTGLHPPMTSNKKTEKSDGTMDSQRLKKVDRDLAATLMNLTKGDTRKIGEASTSSGLKKQGKTGLHIDFKKVSESVENSATTSPPRASTPTPQTPPTPRSPTPPPPQNDRDDNLVIDLNKSPPPSPSEEE